MAGRAERCLLYTSEVVAAVVELKGIEDRVVRLTPNSSDMGSTIISKDGETLYYLCLLYTSRCV